jgi:hypothetical protein
MQRRHSCRQGLAFVIKYMSVEALLLYTGYLNLFMKYMSVEAPLLPTVYISLSN